MLDATCPLVTKVHAEARRYAARGYTIVLVGHEDHDEVIGTMGEAPDAILVIGSRRRDRRSRCPTRSGRLHHPDDALGGRHARDHRGPAGAVPRRSWAAKRRHLLRDPEPPGRGQGAGARRRSGAGDRLAQLLELHADGRGRPRAGVAAHLIDDETGIDPAWLDGVDTVGITSGASAPESLVTRVVEYFRELGVTEIDSHELVDENVHFSLPMQLRRAASAS